MDVTQSAVIVYLVMPRRVETYIFFYFFVCLFFGSREIAPVTIKDSVETLAILAKRVMNSPPFSEWDKF